MGGDEVEIAQRQDTSFLLLSRFMVVEVELINRQFFGEGGLAQLPHSTPCFGFMKAHECLVFKRKC
jgi:hypothetical protein